MPLISPGFGRRRPKEDPSRLPPGQYVTDDFPVLSAGPTPRTDLGDWTFEIRTESGARTVWTWDEFGDLPAEELTADIHCVTKWSKFDTKWRGVSLDLLLGEVGAPSPYVMAFSDGGYTTNLPRDAVLNGKAWVVTEFDGKPLEPVHGGPARLLVPGLYFWKSAKWVRGLQLLANDEPGFWERYGYHNIGDPWLEQRYDGD